MYVKDLDLGFFVLGGCQCALPATPSSDCNVTNQVGGGRDGVYRVLCTSCRMFYWAGVGTS